MSVEKWRLQCINNLHEVANFSDELLDAARLAKYVPTVIEPKTYNSVKHLSPEEQRKWHESMHAEWTSLKKKGVFVLVKRREIDQTATLIPTKWAYKIKSCGHYKSRLCALGNLMAEDKIIDHESPTPSLPVVRLIFSLAAKRAYHIQLLDVCTAFLNAAPQVLQGLPSGSQSRERCRQVYIHLLPNYAEPGYVGLLKKLLYGTSSAPRSWNTLLHNWLQSNGFEVNPHEACLYSGKHNGENVHILIHVDDAALFGNHAAVQWATEEIRKVFECTVDRMERYLGMDAEKIGKTIPKNRHVRGGLFDTV